MTDILTISAVILTIAGASYSISAKHLMRGVLGLALFFIGIAAFFGSMGAWYLAAGQLFLFVGGVVTIFVLAFNFAKTPVQGTDRISGFLVAILALIALFFVTPQIHSSEISSSLSEFASYFFVNYGWVLNFTLLLLFSAVISAQYLLEENA